MNTIYKRQKLRRNKRSFLFAVFSLLILIMCTQARAQAPTISYPTTAGDLSRGVGSSALTVKLVFNGTCLGATTVKLALPPSVTYVPGSISKTGGTAALSITEISIIDLSNPVFIISGSPVTANDITFKVNRRVGCGSLATAKDSIYVFSSLGCSDAKEISGAMNTYNITAPSLSIIAAPGISGVNVGDTLSMAHQITNGGIGCTDTVFFYAVQNPASLATASVMVGGLPLSSFRTSGDTMFYKVFGTQLSPTGLSCNSHIVTVNMKVVVKSCANLDNHYGTGWGANASNICQIDESSTIININNDVPVLTALVASGTAYPTCAGGRRTFTFVLKNTGTSAVHDMKFDMGSFGYFVLHGNVSYDATSLMVKMNALSGGSPFHPTGVIPTNGVLGTSTACAGLNTNSFYWATPTGVELKPGDSITFTFDAVQCSDNACESHSGGLALPALNWGYTTQCAVVYPQYTGGTNTGAGAMYTTQTIVGAATAPAMVSAGACYVAAISANYYSSVTANSYREVKIIVPASTTLSSLTETSGEVPLTGYPVQISDTIWVRYSSTTGAEKSYNLRYNLCPSTAAGAACGAVSIKIQSRTSLDTACLAPMVSTSCKTINLEYMCALPGPCLSGGPGILGFAYGRTSFGLPDNNNDGQPDASGSLDMTKLELNSYRPGDVLKTRYVTNVSVTTTNPTWKYMYGTWSFAGGIWQPKDSTLVKIYKSGTLLYTLKAPVVKNLVQDWFETDWSTALTAASPTFVYSPSTVDSVILESSFRFVSGIVTTPYSVTIEGASVPGNGSYNGVLSQKAFTSQTNPYDLSTVGYCYGPKYNYLAYGEQNGVYAAFNTNANGCTPAVVDYRLHSILNGAIKARYFPFEYRPMVVSDTFEFDAPIGWSVANVNATYTISYAVETNVTIPIAPYVHITGSSATGIHVLVDFKSAYTAGVMPYSSDASHIDVLASVTPSCNAVNLSTPWKWASHFVGYPDSAHQLRSDLTGMLGYSYDTNARANLITQNNTGVVQGIKPQQYWDIQVDNPSITYPAPYLWFALEDGSSNINVDSVVLKPSNVVVSPVAYGSGHKYYKASAAGMAPASKQFARVYFKYISCVADSIKLLTGFDCTAFPADPSTACANESIYLNIVPEPSEVQLTVARQPGGGALVPLCTTDSALLIINSAQAANLVHPYVTLYPPAGFSFVPPINIEYPLGSGHYETATLISLTGGGYKIDLSAHSAIGANGILGTASSDPAFIPAGGDRQAKIKVTFTTDCGYTSGSSLDFRVYGEKPCGQPSKGNGVLATTAALDIVAATAVGSAGMLLDFGVTSLSCGAVSTIQMTTVPTTAATQLGDTIIYTLPTGISYAGNFVKGINCATCDVVTVAGAGGTTIVKVKLQLAVPASSPLLYSFDVKPLGEGCGPARVTAAFKRSIMPLTCGLTTCTGSSVIIANAASPEITLIKPSLSITNMRKLDTAAWVMGWSYTNKVFVNYNNLSGTQDYSANTDTVEFFCGTSAVPFATRPLTKNVAIGASDSDYYEINIPKGTCTDGELVTAKIQAKTAAGTEQCVCAPSSYQMLGVPLPLNFLSATARANNCAVNLNWTYNAAEINKVNSFMIERSANGKEYKTIATLSNKTAAYIDVTPASGNWYYRIKANNADGKSEYTNVFLAHTVLCGENTINVYPNPASNKLQIVLQGTGATVTYSIVDQLGRDLLGGSLSGNANNTVDISNMATGVYLLKINVDGVITNHQINIIK